jgi:hypothetical protein
LQLFMKKQPDITVVIITFATARLKFRDCQC